MRDEVERQGRVLRLQPIRPVRGALTSTGGVECWGTNGHAQLGDGTTKNHTKPVAVSGLANGIEEIAAGGFQTCALSSGGGVECWGGRGRQVVPKPVPTLPNGVRAVSAGSASYACALTSAGGVECWGSNQFGQLGNGTTTDSSTPVAVSGLTSGVRAISAGGFHACALTVDGVVECWGGNDSGQLGDGTTTNRTKPVVVSGLARGVRAISAGGAHTCALLSGGAIECWGYNRLGQLGDGTTTNHTTPVAVSGLASGVRAVSAGNQHTCALTVAGAVECWGQNDEGELGDGTTKRRLRPVRVIALCIVPAMTGEWLVSAKEKLAESTCRTGTIRRDYSARVQRGLVISQSPRPGSRLAQGGKVNLVVSQGPLRYRS